MRIGEVLGLKWEDVDFGDEENNFDDAKLHVRQELQRVNLNILSKIKARREDIFFMFPEIKKDAVTRLVLKTPKTKGSIRTVWIPPTVCHLLKRIEKIQGDHQFALGESYEDFDLVISRYNGRPIEEGRIADILNEQLQKAGLHHVTFHSFRHTSTTIKLLITNGDIKGVQGDNGQTVSRMVTDQYAKIIDTNRKKTATLFEESFFSDEKDTTQEINDDTLKNLHPLYPLIRKCCKSSCHIFLNEGLCKRLLCKGHYCFLLQWI